jgi:DNA-binding cell septation regulator SpoVG
MSTEIIIELRPLEGQKSAKAVGSVTLATDQGEVSIMGVRVMHQENKTPWVSYPRIEYDSKKTGKKEYKDVLNFSHRLQKTVEDAVLAKYRELSENAAPF